MLSEKPWRLEPMARLVMSVLLCLFVGSLILTAVQYFSTGGRMTWKFLLLAVIAAGLIWVAWVLVQKPWRLEDFRRRIISLLVIFYASMLLGALALNKAGADFRLNPTVHTLIGTLSFQGTALILIWRFLREHEVSWAGAFGFSNQRLHAVLIGITAACFFLPVAWGLGKVSEVALHFTRLGLKPEDQIPVQAFRHASGWPDLLALGVVTILLVPAAEEMLFRGILYPAIKQTGFPRVAFWGTSLLFAGIHMDRFKFVPLFALAVILTILYEKTNNLLASITAHATFNAMNLVVLMEQLAQ